MLAHPRKQKAGPESGLRKDRRGEGRPPRRVNLFAAVAAATAAITAAATVTTTPPATAAITAAATATAVAAAITPIAAAKATGTGRTLLARAGDVDRQGAAFHLVAVEFLHGFLGLVAVPHRDERETTGTPRELVEDDLDDIDRADLAEQGLAHGQSSHRPPP